MDAVPFTSAFKPVYDRLVQAPRTISEAVAMCHSAEDQLHLSTPKVYVSTAITSAGFRREKSLLFEEAIARNNQTASLILGSLASTGSPDINAESVMAPTELGRVPAWGDTDYLAFYFTWLSGISVDGAAWLEGRLADAVLAPIIAATNRREQSNDERWPFYQKFVEVLLTTVASAAARRGGRSREASSILLQLVDTSESLGCRAEQMYAEVRGIDRVSVTLGDGLAEPLATHIQELRAMRAELGVTRRPVQQVPVALR
jgi:hypothetical protein